NPPVKRCYYLRNVRVDMGEGYGVDHEGSILLTNSCNTRFFSATVFFSVWFLAAAIACLATYSALQSPQTTSFGFSRRSMMLAGAWSPLAPRSPQPRHFPLNRQIIPMDVPTTSPPPCSQQSRHPAPS